MTITSKTNNITNYQLPISGQKSPKDQIKDYQVDVVVQVIKNLQLMAQHPLPEVIELEKRKAVGTLAVNVEKYKKQYGPDYKIEELTTSEWNLIMKHQINHWYAHPKILKNAKIFIETSEDHNAVMANILTGVNMVFSNSKLLNLDALKSWTIKQLNAQCEIIKEYGIIEEDKMIDGKRFSNSNLVQSATYQLVQQNIANVLKANLSPLKYEQEWKWTKEKIVAIKDKLLKS